MAESQFYSTSSNTGFNAALKEFYLPRLVSTVAERRVLLTRLQRDAGKTDVSGRHARLPINIRGSQAISTSLSDTDGGTTLPTPQSQTFVESQIGYAFNYATVRITHPVMQASKNDKGSFVRAVSSEMDGIRRDLKNDINRQLFGDGTGTLGVVNNDSDTSTTVELQLGHKVKTGMLIDTYSGSTRDNNGASVTAVNSDGTDITVSATLGTAVADGDIVYRKGSKDNEMMGIHGIVSNTGTLQGINRADGNYPEWQSFISAQSEDTAVTEAILDSAILDAQSQNEAETSLMITSPVQFRKIGALLTGNRRYATDMELEGGFTAINWAGIPIVWDVDCPRQGQYTDDDTSGGDASFEVATADNDFIFGLDEDHLAIYQLADWDFDDTDGNIMHRVEGKAAYDATLFWYANLGTTDASKHFKISGLRRD